MRVALLWETVFLETTDTCSLEANQTVADSNYASRVNYVQDQINQHALVVHV